MSISARELTILVQGLCYFTFTISAARQFIREPGQVRFHTLLIFASATITALLLEIGIRLFLAGTQETVALFLLRLSTVCGLFALYALFLLTGDVTNLHPWLGWIGIGMLIFGGGFILSIGGIYPSTGVFLLAGALPLLPLILFAILFGSFLLFTILFWYRSIKASGAIRRRLRWLGASTMLACFSVGFALTRFFVEDGPFTLAFV